MSEKTLAELVETRLDIYTLGERLLSEYKVAREAVRKMEAGLSSDDNS